MWDTLSHCLASVQSHTPRSTEWNDAVRNLKVYLKEAVRPMLLTRLRFFYMTSPFFKKKIFRTTTRTGGKIEHRINFKKDFVALTHDKLGWILAQLVRAEDGLKGLDDITLIIELRRLVEDGNVSTDYVPASVHKSIADLALYAEIWIQCQAYAPAIFYHMSVADRGVESKGAGAVVGYWHQTGIRPARSSRSCSTLKTTRPFVALVIPSTTAWTRCSIQ